MTQHEHQRPRNRAANSAANEQELAPGKRALSEAELAPLLQKLLSTRRKESAQGASPETAGDPWQGLDDIEVPPGSTSDVFHRLVAGMRAADSQRGAEPLESEPIHAANMAVKPKPKNEVLFVGLGTGAKAEERALKKVTKVVGVTDAKHDGEVQLGKATYDLNDPAGLEQYLLALGIEEARIGDVMRLFDGVSGNTRDELGQLVRVYREAETGTRVLERVVLSGHSEGFGIFNYQDERLEFEVLVSLGESFPRAASQVRDLMLSGCNTALEGQMEVYRRCFPNLESVWGYMESSPGTHTGAKDHIKIWEKTTRGEEAPDMAAGRAKAKKKRKGKFVATWSSDEGYVGATPLTLEQARSQVLNTMTVYEAAFNGELAVPDGHLGPLYGFYIDLIRFVHHKDIEGSEREEQRDRVRMTLLLRSFVSDVLPKFVTDYKDQLDAGYAKAGIRQPAWLTLSRAEVIAAANEFADARYNNDDPAIALTYELLEQGLHQLSDDYIVDRTGEVAQENDGEQ